MAPKKIIKKPSLKDVVLVKETIVGSDRTVTQLPPKSLISLAIEKGSPIEYLERLLEMEAKYNARISRQKYFEAFGKFQASAPDLIKNRIVRFDHRDGGGKTEYGYQELGDIAKHIRGPLAENGLSYRWTQSEKANKISVTCIVTHVDGHQEMGEPLEADFDNSGKKNLIQQKASTISYLRRYTLTGILGLSSSDVDNDGAHGMDAPAPKKKAILSKERFEGALKAVNSGEVKLAQIIDGYEMTKEQYAILLNAEKNPKN